MAYQTGTISSMNDLKPIIELFATTNGWTLTGQVLHRDLSYVKLSSVDAETISLEAANSIDFLTTPCPTAKAAYITSGFYPVTYHLFAHASPTIIMCVLVYDSTKVQHLLFGDMVKIHASAYVGGNFISASTGIGALGINNGLYTFSINSLNCITFPMFPGCRAGSSLNPYKNTLHAEIDGNIWGGDSVAAYNLTEEIHAAYYRSPNSVDSHTPLLPWHLTRTMADNLYGYLGYIDHVRLVRVDNYNIGDIIDLSPDKWMVFPWLEKNTTYRDGHPSFTQYSGTLGFAVRYDGP